MTQFSWTGKCPAWTGSSFAKKSTRGEFRPANSPAHRNGELLTKTVVIMKLLVVHAEFVDQLRQLHVIATVPRNIQHLALPEPFDGLQTFRRFLDSERGRGD